MMKQHQVENIDVCLQFIVQNFKGYQLQEEGILKKHPEIGVIGYLFKGEQNRHYKDGKHYSVFQPGPVVVSRFSWPTPVTSELRFSSNATIMLTGVGVTMNQGTEMDIELKILKEVVTGNNTRTEAIGQISH